MDIEVGKKYIYKNRVCIVRKINEDFCTVSIQNHPNISVPVSLLDYFNSDSFSFLFNQIRSTDIFNYLEKGIGKYYNDLEFDLILDGIVFVDKNTKLNTERILLNFTNYVDNEDYRNCINELIIKKIEKW